MLSADDSMFNVTQPGEDAQSERSDAHCSESVQSEKLEDGQSLPSEKADRSTEKDDQGSTAEPTEPADNEQRNENNERNVNGVSNSSSVFNACIGGFLIERILVNSNAVQM